MIRRIKIGVAWGRRLATAALVAALIAICMVGAFALTLNYVAPAKNLNPLVKRYEPIIRDGWIGLPFDIYRLKECPAQSTITLRRVFDNGPPLGLREDVVLIGVYNTTITGKGLSKVILWFRQPPDLWPGAWSYDSKISDDCGGIGDIFNSTVDHPRETSIPNVLIIPEASK